MKRPRRKKRLFTWQVVLGAALVAVTAAVYYVHFLIFRDLHHIFIYFIGDVAFVFTEVLLVALIINHILHRREERAAVERINMLIGAFFSEVGTELLRRLAEFDAESFRIAERLAVPEDWSEREFLGIRDGIRRHRPGMSFQAGDAERLKELLKEKKQFLLSLLQNSSLVEDDSFTNLVWAIFHLTGELTHRPELTGMSNEELGRLASDVRRVYQLLVEEWAEHMNHLRTDYPYLFSMAARNNPFEGRSSVEVK